MYFLSANIFFINRCTQILSVCFDWTLMNKTWNWLVNSIELAKRFYGYWLWLLRVSIFIQTTVVVTFLHLTLFLIMPIFVAVIKFCTANKIFKFSLTIIQATKCTYIPTDSRTFAQSIIKIVYTVTFNQVQLRHFIIWKNKPNETRKNGHLHILCTR